VGTFHAFARSNIGYYYGRRWLEPYLSYLHRGIAVSEPARDFLHQYFPDFPLRVIPNGIDVNAFKPGLAPIRHLRDDHVNILFVGRWEKRKGLRYLMRAFGRVKALRPKTRLVVVGAYDQRQKRSYERWLSENGIRDVVFAGFVSLEDLPRYHHSCHIFCAPNTGNESQGIILLEAMAAGRPVVASNIDGFAAVVTHGVEGLLVRPKDDEALAAALLQLVDDADSRATMSEACSKKAQDYSWERVSQRVLSCYERLAYEKRSASAESAPPSSLVEA